jgi:DnaJ-class molecular chaperone
MTMRKEAQCKPCEGSGRLRLLILEDDHGTLSLDETWCKECAGTGSAITAAIRRHPSGKGAHDSRMQ